MERIVDEPVRGTVGDTAALRLTGLEAMRRMVRGLHPRPPVHHLIGLEATEAGLGTATFTLPVTSWLEDEVGIIWGGVFSLLADAPVGTALYTGLPPGKVVSTTELSINYLRPITRESGHLVGRGRSVYLGNRVGVSEARIEDARGRTMAHASSRCVVQDVPLDPGADPAPPPSPAPAVTEPPDPYLRTPPDSARRAPSIWEGDRLATQRRLIEEDGCGPIRLLTGLRLVAAERGVATFALDASLWFSVGTERMYGGMIAWACDTALSGAVWSTLEPGWIAPTLDLQVRYLRPVTLDGSELRVTGRVVHEGRSIRVSQAEMTNASGKTVAIASGSSMVIAGGIDALVTGRRDELAEELSPAAGSREPAS